MNKTEPTPDEDGEVLVVAMARPSMVGPFTLSSIFISIFVPFMAAMILKTLWLMAAIPFMFAVTYFICSKDVYLFGVLWAVVCKVRASRNKRLWGYRSYAPR
ncbi:VirB3 family type IV secretion system protein [Pseudomonas gingeri]